MIRTEWRQSEIDRLIEAYHELKPFISNRDFGARLGEELGRSPDSVVGKLARLYTTGELTRLMPVPLSTYPIYNEPLEMEGDAVCIGDVETPYHHAEFLSRLFDLADAWKITNLIIVGDFLHLDCLSNFSKNWTGKRKGGITEAAAAKLEAEVIHMPRKQRQIVLDAIDRIGVIESEDGLSAELDEARKLTKRINEQFGLVHYALGNHEGRALKRLDVRVQAAEIGKWLDAQTWCFAPYYYSHLISGGQKYLLEHPVNFSKGSSRALCAKYHANVIQFHGHHYFKAMDISGQYLALEPGCCVDETRLAYAAQRHRTGDMHVVGAAIVRGGVAWDVGLEAQRTDWQRLAGM
jgi:hypothetical protein